LNRRLIIVGDNTDKLATSSPYITFMGKVSEAKLLSLMQEARALLFPQHEDFGMTALEMNACGRPVIAFAKGGALETVIDGVTGVLFDDQSEDSLAAAILRFESMNLSSAEIRRHAENFSKHAFIAEIHRIVQQAHARDGAERGHFGAPYLAVS